MNQLQGLPITIKQQSVVDVNHFTYQGSNISKDGDSEFYVCSRIGKATSVFQRRCKVWTFTTINTPLKLSLHMSIVVPMAIYANETWKKTVNVAKKLDIFHQQCLHKIISIERPHHH